MSTPATARIDLELNGERLKWTPAGFRGYTPRGRRLAGYLERMIRPELKPTHEPSLTRWVEAQLEQLDDLELVLREVRYSPDDGSVPEGAIA